MGWSDGFDAVLAAAEQGNEESVASLYRDLHPRLSRDLLAREPRAAEDLEGEVWLAVAEGISRFSGGEESFRAWVFSIVRRRLADFRRTGARRATVPVPNEELERAAGEDPADIVLEDLSSSAAAAFVIANLSSDQAEIVLLRVIGGFSVEQVAEMLGKRVVTVRVLQHRALRRLHAELTKGGVT